MLNEQPFDFRADFSTHCGMGENSLPVLCVKVNARVKQRFDGNPMLGCQLFDPDFLSAQRETISLS